MPIGLNVQQTILALNPIYLPTGNHSLIISAPYSTTWQQLSLSPRFPSENQITPSDFNPAHPLFVPLTNTATVFYTWKWYHNYNYAQIYNFYKIQLFGHSKILTTTQVAVSIDNNFIGTTILNPDGTLGKPLFEELSNGGTHTIAITPVDLKSEQKMYLNAVQIEKYENPLIFAGSSMRWSKEVNHRVTTSNSVVHLPSGIILSKDVKLEAEGRYNIMLRYRVESSVNETAQLHFDIGGWTIGKILTPENWDWQEHTFTYHLTAGEHSFQLWWENASQDEAVDIMYVMIEKQ